MEEVSKVLARVLKTFGRVLKAHLHGFLFRQVTSNATQKKTIKVKSEINDPILVDFVIRKT